MNLRIALDEEADDDDFIIRFVGKDLIAVLIYCRFSAAFGW